jgi:hypothetical protein
VAVEFYQKSYAHFKGTIKMRSFPNPESAEEWLLTEG